MASDPEDIVDTLHQLARLDLVELGLAAVLNQIVQAATSCCGITGGVGLLLLGPDDPAPLRRRRRPAPQLARRHPAARA